MTGSAVATAWMVLGVALFIAEIFMPGFVVAVFGLASLAAATCAFLGWSLNTQLLTFAATTIFSFVALRPMALRYLDAHGDAARTNVAALVGKVGVVTQPIDPAVHTGRVRVEGDDWRAELIGDGPLEVGRKVEVTRVEGTRLFVRPL